MHYEKIKTVIHFTICPFSLQRLSQGELELTAMNPQHRPRVGLTNQSTLLPDFFVC